MPSPRAHARPRPGVCHHGGMSGTSAARRIFLVGPMGAGKTSVGRQLARRLGLEFVDADHEIERRTGVDIPYIFEVEGEAGFRERERRVLAELTLRPGIVLATGGGAVLDEANRAVLAARGTVVYLHASVGEQLRRTRGDRRRPLLQVADPAARLAELMAVREPLYRAVADLVVETDGRGVRSVVGEIVRRLPPPKAGERAGPAPEAGDAVV